MSFFSDMVYKELVMVDINKVEVLKMGARPTNVITIVL